MKRKEFFTIALSGILLAYRTHEHFEMNNFTFTGYLGVLSAMLSGCGGGDPISSITRIQEPVRLVAVADVPNLYRCLDTIDISLKKSSQQADVRLDCAGGVYSGLTHDGRLCSLKIDGAMGSFEFEVDHEQVLIRWGITAIAADGTPIHNLEDASAPMQPGVMLTKFTGALQPVTEALILRMSGGVPVLPKMIYQRFEGNSTRSVQCNFGA